ncbi:MAG: hypothetical protein U0V49_06285 [Saprospiraceae bacterium]
MAARSFIPIDKEYLYRTQQDGKRSDLLFKSPEKKELTSFVKKLMRIVTTRQPME